MYLSKRGYREAVHKWDEALQLTPEDATLYEMKSQDKMEMRRSIMTDTAFDFLEEKTDMMVTRNKRKKNSEKRGSKYIMRKAGLDESPVGIKIAGININNLRYADDTTLMAESEEELKSLMMRVKEESAKVGVKLNIKKTKIMASGPLTSWQIDGEEMEVLMSLHEMFPAVLAAEMAVQRDPHSWEAWQTLGRAQLGLGEIALAIRSFQIALHICPLSPELWNEDLSWARKLQREKAAKMEAGTERTATQQETSNEPIPDYDFESDEIVAVCAAIAEKEKTTLASKTVVIVSASGAVETVTEKEECATTPDGTVFIKAR
ncbi:Tetratricopeptide repeat protein 33 [Varanus komodoensis]|nr:Tetratricopeptide repeat protein 33 [Varanus komodoensis]